MKRSFVAVALWIFFMGCSMHPKSPNGIEVKLDASGEPSTVMDRALSQLASFATMAVPSASPTLDSLDCFAVNAKGGVITSSSTCGGSVQLGVTDGAYSAMNSTFKLLVPAGEGTTFEAYGFETNGGGCSSISSLMSSGATVYKIGSVSKDISENSLVSIPINFSAGSAFTCTGAPYLIYFDGFDYTSGFLSSEPSWTQCNGIASSMPVSSSAISTWSISAGNCFGWSGTTNPTKPFTRVSITNDMNGGGVGATVHTVILGISTDVSGASASGLGCTFAYSSSSATNMNITVGSFTSSSFNPSGSMSGGLTVAAASRLVCEINSAGGGNVVVTAKVYDATGSSLLQTYSSSTLPENTSANNAYLYIDGGGSAFGTSSTADSFAVEQAASAQ